MESKVITTEEDLKAAMKNAWCIPNGAMLPEAGGELIGIVITDTGDKNWYFKAEPDEDGRMYWVQSQSAVDYAKEFKKQEKKLKESRQIAYYGHRKIS